MTGSKQTEARPICLVVDTNVLVEVFTVADLIREAKNSGPDSADFESRRRRLYDTFALALYLHDQSACTLNLRHEGTGVIARLAPPDDDDSLFTYLVIHFVRQHLLNRWKIVVEPDRDKGFVGNDADDLLLKLATERSTPPITRDVGLQRKALNRSIAVHTPEGYLNDKDWEAEVSFASFLERFDSAMRLEVERRLDGRHKPSALTKKYAQQLVELRRYYSWLNATT